MMKIGFGQADITPRGGKVSLLGQFHQRITDQVLDPLYAVAMIIESENARTIWVAADTAQMYEPSTRMVMDEVRKVIPDMKDEEFVLSATHIHTGPALWLDTFLSLTGDRSEPEEALPAAECNRQFALGIAEAVKDALGSMKDAHMDVSVARIQTGSNRRVTYKDGSAQMYGNAYRPDFLRMEGRDGGPTQLIYVYDDKNELYGVVAAVPCTAQCDEKACYVTGDYWGVVRDRVRAELGENVKVLGLCRAAGDLSPHHIVDRVPMERDEGLYHGRKAAVYMGNLIADAIVSHRKYVIASYDSSVSHVQGMRRVDFPVWMPTEEEYKWALDYLGNQDNFNEDGSAKVAFDNGNAHARKLRYERGQTIYPSSVYCTVLGDVVFLTVPFELYIEYADRIRMALGDKMVFDIQLTYDNLGYLATPQAVAGGHYSANIFNGVCGPEGGEKLIVESVALARELIK